MPAHLPSSCILSACLHTRTDIHSVSDDSGFRSQRRASGRSHVSRRAAKSSSSGETDRWAMIVLRAIIMAVAVADLDRPDQGTFSVCVCVFCLTAGRRAVWAGPFARFCFSLSPSVRLPISPPRLRSPGQFIFKDSSRLVSSRFSAWQRWQKWLKWF
ncbi:hypothetical protein IWZ03DRAFT_379627 [Phyllosticta citriasiana]|uniref:Uncharacterized protein n=1 Tax=Phyllosticta citriasiana TaxID=595635 RepID=A0ABR1KIE7_9PEZI